MNNIQSGSNISSFTQQTGQSPAPRPTAPDAAAASAPKPAHTLAPGPASYSPSHMMGYMSPAYFMAAAQMMMMSSQAGMPTQMPSGMPAGMAAPAATGTDSATATGGHVTSNATNSLVAAQSAQPGAMPGVMPGAYGMSGVNNGMMGAMAMPVGFMMMMPMTMSPVFGVFFGFAAMPGAAPSVPQSGSTPAALLPAQSPVAEQAPVATEVAAPAAAPSAEEAPVTEDADAKPPVVQVAAEDFNQLKMRSRSSQLETSLQLSLTTRDGDKITLDFSQIDLFEKSRLSDPTAEGGRRHRHEVTERHDRVVNMNVEGDLDDVERAAVDAVLAEVIELANKFFTGNLDGVMQRLQSFDLDTEALSEFSLQMNMTKSVEFSRAHHKGRDSEIARLAGRDGEVMKMLEFLATEQRTLIRSASEVLDSPSAVKLVKALLPPLLEEPFAKLAETLDAADDAEMMDEDVTGSPDLGESEQSLEA